MRRVVYTKVSKAGSSLVIPCTRVVRPMGLDRGAKVRVTIEDVSDEEWMNGEKIQEE